MVYKQFKRGRRSVPKEIEGDYSKIAELLLDPMIAELYVEEEGRMLRLK